MVICCLLASDSSELDTESLPINNASFSTSLVLCPAFSPTSSDVPTVGFATAVSSFW